MSLGFPTREWGPCKIRCVVCQYFTDIFETFAHVRMMPWNQAQAVKGSENDMLFVLFRPTRFELL